MGIPKNKQSVILNGYQGQARRVLAVCSGGVLRSPTIQNVCIKEFDFNARCCGTEDYALIPLTPELMLWADDVICADSSHYWMVEAMVQEMLERKDLDVPPLIHVLGIPDDYEYMSEEIVGMVRQKLKELYDPD